MARSRSRSGRTSSRHAVAKRSARELGVRGAIALGALLFAYFSITGTLANVVVKAAPSSAYNLAWWDGRVTGAFALQRFSEGPDTNPRSEQSVLARRALQQDATAVDALNVL